MLKWLKLSHVAHTAHLRPHEHTSYVPLGILLLVVGLSLIAYTAAASSPGPEAGSIGLTGTVPAVPPTVAAIITSPKDQQHFNTSPVTYSGTCPANTLVEMYKNDIFAGSVNCTSKGTFSVDIDLLFGENKIIARVYDVLNQAGPDSAPITNFYDVLPAQSGALTPIDFGGTQLLLNTDAVFRGSFPGQELSVPIDVLGGTPPYAVNIQWGDSNNKVVPRNSNDTFNAGHTYAKPGTYQISIQATDAAGRVAFITVASIINGQPSATGTGSTSTPASTTNELLVLWPLYTSAIGILGSFWLGERREKQILRKRGLLLPTKPA
ncbi:hypothetical protein EPN95_02305 [Patescibacteria group bacterium]|nr:MAG: hypothetical protein EPN95_02305 [Patescibacteria group bacterium]